MATIFERLTKLAIDAGLPLTKAADLAGVPHSTLWEWKQKTPKTLKHYENLLKVLQPAANNAIEKDKPDQPTQPNKP